MKKDRVYKKMLLWSALSLSISANATEVVWTKQIIHLHSAGFAYLIDPNTDEVTGKFQTVKGGTLGTTTPNAQKVYIGGAAENQREVVILDLEKQQITGRLETGNRPKHPLASPDGKWVGINHWGLDNGKLRVTFIDVSNDSITKQIELEVSNPNPKGVTSMHNAWSADSKLFFTLDRVDNELVIINIETWSVKNIKVDSEPHYAVPSPDGKELWLIVEGNAENKPGIVVYDLTKEEIPIISKMEMPLIGEEVAEAHHGNFTQDGRFFFALNRGSGKDARGREVAIFDSKNKQLVHRLTAASNGVGHTYNSPDGKYAVVTNYGNNVISIIDVAAQRIVKDLKIGNGRMGHIAFTQDSKFGYISNEKDGVLYKLDMEKLAVIKTIITNGQNGGGQVLNVWTNVFEELPR
jgi:DNA-binding beta-propeller fold protein YncE